LTPGVEVVSLEESTAEADGAAIGGTRSEAAMGPSGEAEVEAVVSLLWVSGPELVLTCSWRTPDSGLVTCS
jgi:hypothetical protein